MTPLSTAVDEHARVPYGPWADIPDLTPYS